MAAWLILSAVPDARTGRRLARELVRKKCAACVSCAGAGFSVYRWKGRIESAKESMLVVKTSSRRLKEAMRLVRKQHPYALPEMLVLPARGSKEYLKWIEDSVK